MKIHFRPARPSDVAKILQLHVEQQRLQGSNYEPPPFDGMCIIDAMVGEVNGQIIGCFYCEAIVEMRFVAIDPRFTAHAQREVAGLVSRLKAQGLRWLECFVPRSLEAKISKPLMRAGFKCEDKTLAHYTLDMR